VKVGNQPHGSIGLNRTSLLLLLSFLWLFAAAFKTKKAAEFAANSEACQGLGIDPGERLTCAFPSAHFFSSCRFQKESCEAIFFN
jgi:hypothetical protein